MYLSTDYKNIKIKDSITSIINSFMFKLEPIQSGLRFKHHAIHTFFMYQPVDIVMTDANNKILYLYQSLAPWHIILPKNNVTYTYAFAANTMDSYSLDDKLLIKKR